MQDSGGLAPTARRAVRGGREPAGEPARPFVKWVGGKRQLLDEIRARVPTEFGTYHEPFVGGGAIFFGLRPHAAVLSDLNERLVRAYAGIKNDAERVIDVLRSYRNTKKFYLSLRTEAPDARTDAEVAAWLIYLNKVGYNGLYRVNKRNHFNVPYGDNKRATICDAENLRACARALESASIHHEDFSAVADRARPGDLVYFDPPYVPLSVTSYFTSYTHHGFGMKEQRTLRDVAVALKEGGVHVLLSNSEAPAVHELYKGFQRIAVSATRMVNCKPGGRGKITELLIR